MRFWVCQTGWNVLEEGGADDKQAVVYNAFDHGCHWGHLDLIFGALGSRVVGQISQTG